MKLRIKIPVLIIWCLILVDSLSGLLNNLGAEFTRVGLVVKIFVILFILATHGRFLKKNVTRTVYLLIAVLFVFWLAAVFISPVDDPEFSILDSFVKLNRYFFFFVLALLVFGAEKDESYPARYRKILDIFFAGNSLLIIAGAVFVIPILSTYDPTDFFEGAHRWGYKGLINGPNEVAAIYIIGLAYVYRENFSLGNRKPILLGLVIVASLLTGAKAAMIAVVLLSAFYLARYRVKTLLFLVVPAVSLGIYYVLKNWELIQRDYLQYTLDSIQKHGGIVSFMFSGRLGFVSRNFDFMGEHWSWLNYIVGDAFLYSEADLLDLYYFFGIGAVFYLYVYLKILFVRDRSRDNYFAMLVLLMAAFAAGHVVQSGIVPLFLILYIFSKETVSFREI